MIKRLLLACLLGLAASGCGDSRNHAHAVYMLVDTSGTYAQEAGKARVIINYLLGTLQSGDSLAVARVETRSFSEKDIIAKATFDNRPSYANAQKRAFRDNVDGFLKNVKGSLTRGSYIKGLESIKNLQTLGGTLSYGSGNHVGLTKMFMVQARGGQLAPVK